MSIAKRIQTVALVFTVVLLSGCSFTDESSSDSQTLGQPGGGSDSVDLAWAAPSTRTDGTYISPTELGGYIVYIGTTSSNLRPLVDLNSGSITQYTVSNLSAGSYYFAISVYDTSGAQSGFSQIIHINIS